MWICGKIYRNYWLNMRSDGIGSRGMPAIPIMNAWMRWPLSGGILISKLSSKLKRKSMASERTTKSDWLFFCLASNGKFFLPTHIG